MKAFRTFAVLLLIAFFVLLTNSDLQAQCAMCAGALNDKVNNGTSHLGEGLNKGILYLMSFPYIIFGTIAFFWYKASKKRRQSI
jgi:hypothetical protein